MGGIVRRFGPSARRLAEALTGDRHLAEDAVQQAFVAALARLGALRSHRAFAAWFRQIVRTEARRAACRARRPPPGGAPKGADRAHGPAECAASAETRARVREAVSLLPDAGREAVVAFYFDGRSIAETARHLGVPVGTAKRRLHDARGRLRALFGEDPPASD